MTARVAIEKIKSASRSHLETKLIADNKAECASRTRRHLQRLSRAKVEQHAPPAYLVMNGDDALDAVKKQHVDRKAHAERMHGPAACEQQRFVGRKMIAAQQTAHPLARGLRDRNGNAGSVSAME
jgi:hypothetical protein